jgi:hypothetical protein
MSGLLYQELRNDFEGLYQLIWKGVILALVTSERSKKPDLLTSLFINYLELIKWM